MTRKQLIETAEAMDVPVHDAMTARVRYLAEQRDKLMESIEGIEDDILFDDSLNDTTKVFLGLRMNSEKVELAKINREIKSYTQLPKEGEITDDMVEQARQFPIENLIELKGGRCIAFCHPSNSYSMVKSRTGNYLWCNVCSKSFGTIDIRIFRDGMSFPEAVRSLI